MLCVQSAPAVFSSTLMTLPSLVTCTVNVLVPSDQQHLVKGERFLLLLGLENLFHDLVFRLEIVLFKGAGNRLGNCWRVICFSNSTIDPAGVRMT